MTAADRGNAAVELVVAVPMLLVVVVVGLQTVVWTTAGARAQDAARVAVLSAGQRGADAAAEAGHDALPAGLRQHASVVVEPAGDTAPGAGLVRATVTVQVPALAAWLPAELTDVTRSAVGTGAADGARATTGRGTG